MTTILCESGGAKKRTFLQSDDISISMGLMRIYHFKFSIEIPGKFLCFDHRKDTLSYPEQVHGHLGPDNEELTTLMTIRLCDETGISLCPRNSNGRKGHHDSYLKPQCHTDTWWLIKTSTQTQWQQPRAECDTIRMAVAPKYIFFPLSKVCKQCQWLLAYYQQHWVITGSPFRAAQDIYNISQEIFIRFTSSHLVVFCFVVD